MCDSLACDLKCAAGGADFTDVEGAVQVKSSEFGVRLHTNLAVASTLAEELRQRG